MAILLDVLLVAKRMISCYPSGINAPYEGLPSGLGIPWDDSEPTLACYPNNPVPCDMKLIRKILKSAVGDTSIRPSLDHLAFNVGTEHTRRQSAYLREEFTTAIAPLDIGGFRTSPPIIPRLDDQS